MRVQKGGVDLCSGTGHKRSLDENEDPRAISFVLAVEVERPKLVFSEVIRFSFGIFCES